MPNVEMSNVECRNVECRMSKCRMSNVEIAYLNTLLADKNKKPEELFLKSNFSPRSCAG
jgi:hypothetical protein